MIDRTSAEDSAVPAIGDTPAPEYANNQVLEQLRGLREVFDAKIRYDEARERLVEAMSEELLAYRQDLYQKLLRPVLLDLIGLYDDLMQVLESADSAPTTNTQLGFFRDSIEQILERNGAELFAIDGEDIDRTHQKVVQVTETPNQNLDRRLDRRLRPGFSWNGKVLRPEWVTAYRYVAAPPEQGQLAAATGNDLPTQTTDPQ